MNDYGSTIATFVDRYGDERSIHKTKSGLRVQHDRLTPTALLNGPIGVLVGEKIRARRLALGLSMEQLAVRCGWIGGHPKQRVHAIEKPPSTRGKSILLGTLYWLADALECSPIDLLPTRQEIQAAVADAKNHSPVTLAILKKKGTR